MKQLIVMIATVLLGIFLFQMICGGQEGSVINSMKSVWNREIEVRTHVTQ